MDKLIVSQLFDNRMIVDLSIIRYQLSINTLFSRGKDKKAISINC